MLIKVCDKCGQDVDKLRRFTIQEVDPIYNFPNIKTSYDMTRLKCKDAVLDLCVNCAKAMGFEKSALVKKEKPIEDVFRAFIAAIVEDVLAEHSNEE